MSPSEFAAINNAHVKLFVITSTSRSLFPMVLVSNCVSSLFYIIPKFIRFSWIFLQASYFIGIGANVVLCIQYLPDKCVIGSDEVSFSYFNLKCLKMSILGIGIEFISSTSAIYLQVWLISQKYHPIFFTLFQSDDPLFYFFN